MFGPAISLLMLVSRMIIRSFAGAAFTTSIDQLGQQTLKNLKDEQTVLAQHDDDVVSG